MSWANVRKLPYISIVEKHRESVVNLTGSCYVGIIQITVNTSPIASTQVKSRQRMSTYYSNPIAAKY